MKTLELKDLNIEIENKLILKDINLKFETGKTYLIVGPNGHGKSTLFKSIFKHYSTQIKSGKMIFNNENINDLTTDQIAKKGLYLATQSPVEIPGLKTLDLLRNELSNDENKKIKILDLYKQINEKIKKLDLNEQILKRNINENFSGGEKKKIEILQLELLNPDFIFLDEIDSGLDVSALSVISDILKEQQKQNKAIIYISHNEKLTLSLKPDYVILIIQGEVIEIGDVSLYHKVTNEGYDWTYKKYNLTKKINKKEFEEFYCNVNK